MTNCGTFTLSDLTEEFFAALCYVDIIRSSGLGGPGCIRMITETGQEYFLGIEGYDEYRPEETVPLLTTYDGWDKEKCRKVYRLEDEGWIYARDFATDVLIRNDIYEKMNKLYYKTENKKLEHGDCYALIQRVLGQENNMVKRVYSETKKQWDKEEQERLKAEEKRKRHDTDEKNRSRFNTDIHEGLTFRNLRNYLSMIDRLSICMLETLNYENYICIGDVPHTYDDYYVYGIGMIDSEFYKINKYEYAASGDRKDLTLAPCIEVMLAREPKGILLEKESEEDMGETEK